MAVREPARHVRLDLKPPGAEREDHYRQSSQAIGVEVPIDHHPVAPVACPRKPRPELECVRQERGIVQRCDWVAEERLEVLGPCAAARGQHTQQTSRHA